MEFANGLIGEQVAESLLLVTLADDPAAGAELTILVPGRATWQPILLAFDLVTDATVANRLPRLEVDDQTNNVLRVGRNTAQPASLTWRYSINFGGGVSLDGGAALAPVIALPPVTLPPGFRMRTNTIALQAGDNYGAPALLVRELPERGTLAELAVELRELRHRLGALGELMPELAGG